MGSKESKVNNAWDESLPTVTYWNPSSYYDTEDVATETEQKHPFALLILNQRITDKKCFAALWRKSTVRVCADGGANRLFDSLSAKERSRFLPNSITGDLDSLRPDVRAFYESRGVEVSQDADQDSTDFAKCLRYIATHDPPDSFVTPSTVEASLSAEGVRVEHPKMTVIALGGFGGRVDQSFHSIHMLYVAQQGPGLGRQIYLFSEENTTFLLAPGRNIIKTPQSLLGPCCGIVPVGGPSTISTEGFEWNLTNTESKFGGIVSTSNHTVADVVKVDATEPIVFTIEFRKDS